MVYTTLTAEATAAATAAAEIAYSTHIAIATRIAADVCDDRDAVRTALRAAYMATPEYVRARAAEGNRHFWALQPDTHERNRMLMIAWAEDEAAGIVCDEVRRAYHEVRARYQ